MIIPIDALSDTALRNIVESFVLQEGTDYGETEVDFSVKVEQVMKMLTTKEAVIVYSELHDSIDIKPAV